MKVQGIIGQVGMRLLILALVGISALVPAAMAQQEGGTKVAFGGLKGDPSLPVTVTSQTLTVDEAAGTALFEGDVLVVQGQMRLSADRVRAIYDEKTERIERLWAEGNVILVNADDAAQSETAEYVIDDGLVTMLGTVVLTQGPATFTAARMVADLTTGFGQLQGGVTSTFTPSAAP
jgi:lipopolysaccharide export system protein LptA